jgi:hypothetical protein
MIRKLAISAVVAFIPAVAFAATPVSPVPADSATHAVSGEAKTDSSVKTDASAKPDKVVHHKAAKTKGVKAKAGAASDGKIDSSKL